MDQSWTAKKGLLLFQSRLKERNFPSASTYDDFARNRSLCHRLIKAQCPGLPTPARLASWPNSLEVRPEDGALARDALAAAILVHARARVEAAVRARQYIRHRAVWRPADVCGHLVGDECR